MTAAQSVRGDKPLAQRHQCFDQAKRMRTRSLLTHIFLWCSLVTYINYLYKQNEVVNYMLKLICSQYGFYRVTIINSL